MNLVKPHISRITWTEPILNNNDFCNSTKICTEIFKKDKRSSLIIQEMTYVSEIAHDNTLIKFLVISRQSYSFVKTQINIISLGSQNVEIKQQDN